MRKGDDKGGLRQRGTCIKKGKRENDRKVGKNVHPYKQQRKAEKEGGRMVNCKKKRPVKNSCLLIVGLLQNRSES